MELIKKPAWAIEDISGPWVIYTDMGSLYVAYWLRNSEEDCAKNPMGDKYRPDEGLDARLQGAPTGFMEESVTNYFGFNPTADIRINCGIAQEEVTRNAINKLLNFTEISGCGFHTVVKSMTLKSPSDTITQKNQSPRPDNLWYCSGNLLDIDDYLDMAKEIILDKDMPLRESTLKLAIIYSALRDRGLPELNIANYFLYKTR